MTVGVGYPVRDLKPKVIERMSWEDWAIHCAREAYTEGRIDLGQFDGCLDRIFAGDLMVAPMQPRYELR